MPHGEQSKPRTQFLSNLGPMSPVEFDEEPSDLDEELVADIDDESFAEKKVPYISPATTFNYDIVERLWNKYVRTVKFARPEKEVVINVEWAKRFFNKLKKRKGLIGNQLSTQSLLAYASRLQAIAKRKYGLVLDKDDMKQIRDYIKHDIGTSDRDKKKYIMRPSDFTEMMRYLWFEDIRKFHIERQRLQFHWFYTLMYLSVSRPGAIVTTKSYEEKGYCLQYKDCQLWVVRDEKGHRHRTLEITFRHRKNEAWSDKEDLKIEYKENLVRPSECLVKPFIVFALLDQVFEDETTLEKIYNSDIKRSKVHLQFKDSALEIPVLRQLRSNKGLTYAACEQTFRQLGHDMGYKIPPNFYTMRRWGANQLNKQKNPTSQGHILGHKKSGVYDAHYHEKKVTIDLAAVVMGKPAEPDYTIDGSTLDTLRFPNAPRRLTSEQLTNCYQNEEVYSLQRKYKQLQENGANGTELLKVDRQINQKRQKARDMTLKRVRMNYFREQEGTCFGEYLDEKPDAPELHPIRQKVADMLFSETVDDSIEQSIELVKDMLAMSKLSGVEIRSTLESSRGKRSISPKEADGCFKRIRFDKFEIRTNDNTCDEPSPDWGIKEQSECYTTSPEDTYPDQPSLQWCQYFACLHHTVPLPSLDDLRAHWLENHSKLRLIKNLCTNEECASHRGHKRTQEMKLRHVDLHNMICGMRQAKGIQSRLMSWQPAEILA